MSSTHTCPETAILVGVLGDFVTWGTVPYVIEDIRDSKRGVYRFDNDRGINYVSIATEIAILMHVLRYYAEHLNSVELILFTPVTLATSNTAKSYLGDIYWELCNWPDVREEDSVCIEDVLKRITSAFAEKLKSIRNILRSKNIADYCIQKLEPQIKFHEVLAEFLKNYNLALSTHDELCVTREFNINQLFSSNIDSIDKKIKFTIRFIALPAALTHVCSNGTDKAFNKRIRKNTIVTFRLSEAADVSGAFMLGHIVVSVLRLLRQNYRKLLLIIDSTHGINYIGASLISYIMNYLISWLRGLTEVLEDLSISVRIYNSDPVISPTLEIECMSEQRKLPPSAYKIHLVYNEDISTTKTGGNVQAFIVSNTSGIDLGSVAEDLVNFVLRKLNNTNVGSECVESLPKLVCLLIQSCKLGLPIWTLLYSKKFINELNIEIKDPLNTLIRLIKPPSFKRLYPNRIHNVVNVDYKEQDIFVFSRVIVLLLSLALILLAYKRVLDSRLVDIKLLDINESILHRENENIRIYTLAAISFKFRDNNVDSIRREYEKVFRWLGRQSFIVFFNEIVSDEKVSECTSFCYAIGNIDERNFVAHAGLSRGAVIWSFKCPLKKGESRAVMLSAVIADTNQVREILLRL